MSKRQRGPTVEIRKALQFRIPVHLSRNSGSKNRPIRLKFGTNVHELSKTRCIIFNAQSVIDLCTGAHKRLTTHCDLQTEFLLRTF